MSESVQLNLSIQREAQPQVQAPVAVPAVSVVPISQKKKLSIYIAHGSITYGKMADRPSPGTMYAAYDPDEIAILIFHHTGTNTYEVKQYRDGFNIEQEVSAEEATETKPETHITSIPRILSASDLLGALDQIMMTQHIDPAEIMLALDGNLGNPGSEVLSECFYTFVGALHPGRLIIFTNTKECREAGEAYFAANEASFLDRGVVKSTELKTAILGMRERRAAESTALMEPDARENEVQATVSAGNKSGKFRFFSCCCPCGRRNSPIGDSSKPAERSIDIENIEMPSVRTATNITPSARDGENSMTERQFTI
ncbi:MAG: hypothetical protein K0U37_05545 [Gammaproteobacteria bacterium]|nr:hypothetical protein [Gammaproteobacteria bacterium]